MARDAVFGSLFAGIRYNIIDENSNRFERMYASVIAGGVGTIYHRHLFCKKHEVRSGQLVYQVPPLSKFFLTWLGMSSKNHSLAYLQGRLRVDGHGQSRNRNGNRI